jgi:phosphatidate cytidylyltransferase
MYKALKNLSATEQIGALFIIVFGLLLLAGIVVFLLSMRESEDANVVHRRSCDIENLSRLLRTSWLMIFVFWVAWISGDVARLVLFGFGSFFALREFLTLSPTRHGDHRSLILAFFVVSCRSSTGW